MLRSFARLDIVVALCCMALLGYINWHVYLGPRGMAYSDKLKEEIATRQARLDARAKTRIELEARARLLRPESIDPDMVEELARRDLALVRDNDRIIKLTP
jgi:cell division protein FtsB